jgi:hypothetical protein
LLQSLEFVDPLQNSIVPLSNEFAMEVTEIARDFSGKIEPLGGENAIFAVFGEG